MPPELKEYHNKAKRPLKELDVPGAIKKPVHPASFTFMGFHRNSIGQNRSPVAQSGSKSPQSNLAANKTAQNKNDAKLMVTSPSSGGGASLDLKTPAAIKSKGVAALNLNTTKHQGTTQHTLSPPGVPKKPQIPTLQRTPNTKSVKTVAMLAKNGTPNQASTPQPLNLQNTKKDVQGNGAAPTSGIKTAANPANRKEYMSPKSPGSALQNRNDKAKEMAEIKNARNVGPKIIEVTKDGKKVNELSAGEEGSSSDSDADFGSRIVASNEWKPTRSLIEHVFVTDVTANLVTVTVKESPTSVGFFSIRNY